MASTDNGPPDWEPTKLYEALTERPKPSAVVELPVRSYSGQPYDKVRIQVLRKDEQIKVRLRAEKLALQRARENKLEWGPDAFASNPQAQELLQSYSALETLALAVVGANGIEGRTTDGRPTTHYPRIFRGAEDLERIVHDDELTTLWAQYLAIQRERGPLVSVLTEEEVDAWVATLKEAADALPLARLTWPALAKLCLSLALRQGKSPGSNPDFPPSEESQNGQESPGTSAPTGTFSSGERPASPGLVISSPDDGSVPIGADPHEAAELVREFESPSDLA